MSPPGTPGAVPEGRGTVTGQGAFLALSAVCVVMSFQQLVAGAISADLAVGCACHELLLFHLLLITLSFIFSSDQSLLSVDCLCSVIVCALELGYSWLLCLYPRTRREKDCRSLPRSTLRCLTCAGAGSWSVISSWDLHLIADRSWITPETCALFCFRIICFVFTFWK